MVVNEDSEVAGSVSGGCVEGAVLEEALDVLQGVRSPRLVSYGIADEDAFAVGLTCGGTIRIFIEDLALEKSSEVYERLRDAIRAEEPVALATMVSGPAPGAKILAAPGHAAVGTLGQPDLDRVVGRDALAELAAGITTMRHYGLHGEARQEDVSVLIESFAPPPQMIIFGAVDFTAALTRVAKVLGYRVTVCDARGVFATRQRFPEADEVIVDWPDRHLAKVGPTLGPRDAVCVLTHDHKFDVPAIIAASATDAGYIGAMGSRRTHNDRVTRLQEAGVTDAQFARLMAPMGSTSVPARRRRPRCRSVARSSPTAPAGRCRRSARATGPCTAVTIAAVVLAAGAGSRFESGPKLLAEFRGRPLVAAAVEQAAAAGLDETVVVTGAVSLESVLPAGVTVVHNSAWRDGIATSLQAAVGHATAAGHDAVVIGLGDQPLVPTAAWAAVAASDAAIAVAVYAEGRRNPVRLARSVWALLPTTGDEGARAVMRLRPDLVEEIPCAGDPADVDTVADLKQMGR